MGVVDGRLGGKEVLHPQFEADPKILQQEILGGAGVIDLVCHD